MAARARVVHLNTVSYSVVCSPNNHWAASVRRWLFNPQSSLMAGEFECANRTGCALKCSVYLAVFFKFTRSKAK